MAVAAAASLWFYGGKEPVRVHELPDRYEWQFDDVVVAYAFPWTPVLAVLWSYFLLRAGQSIIVAAVAANDLNRLRVTERRGCCQTLGGMAALVAFHLGTASITALLDLLLAPFRAVLVIGVGDQHSHAGRCGGCWGFARAVLYSGRLGGVSTGAVGANMAKLHWANILKLLQRTSAATGPVMLYNGLVAALLKLLVVVIHGIVLLFYLREHHPGLRYYMVVLLASAVPTYLVASAAIGVVVNVTDAVTALFGLEICLAPRLSDARIGGHLRGLLPVVDHGGGYDDRDAIQLVPLGAPAPLDRTHRPEQEHAEWQSHHSDRAMTPARSHLHDQPAHGTAGTAGRGRERFAWAPRQERNRANDPMQPPERGLTRVRQASGPGPRRPSGPTRIRLAEHSIDAGQSDSEPLPFIRAPGRPGATGRAEPTVRDPISHRFDVDDGDGDSDAESSDVDADELYRDDRLDGFDGMDRDHPDGHGSGANAGMALPGAVTTQSPSPPTSPEASHGGEQGLCVICLIERANQVLSPCKHLCLCRGCLAELRTHNAAEAQLNQARPGEPLVSCPICRTAVTGTLSIYLS